MKCTILNLNSSKIRSYVASKTAKTGVVMLAQSIPRRSVLFCPCRLATYCAFGRKPDRLCGRGQCHSQKLRALSPFAINQMSIYSGNDWFVAYFSFVLSVKSAFDVAYKKMAACFHNHQLGEYIQDSIFRLMRLFSGAYGSSSKGSRACFGFIIGWVSSALRYINIYVGIRILIRLVKHSVALTVRILKVESASLIQDVLFNQKPPIESSGCVIYRIRVGALVSNKKIAFLSLVNAVWYAGVLLQCCLNNIFSYHRFPFFEISSKELGCDCEDMFGYISFKCSIYN